MEVVCKHCQKKLKLPADKVPAGRSFAFNCPSCQQRINVEAAETMPAPASATRKAAAPAPNDRASDNLSAIDQAGYNASEKPFDFVAPGAQTALLCEIDPQRVSIIREYLEQQEYYIREPATVMEALKLMRFHLFDLIVVHSAFDSSTNNAVCAYLARQPMSIRRNIFVLLISPELRTMDNMAAFNQSVNLIMNEKNIADFDKILSQAMTEQADFYRIFKDTLTRVGKG